MWDLLEMHFYAGISRNARPQNRSITALCEDSRTDMTTKSPIEMYL